ncbi:ABC transporter permease [Microbacterium amylolyticum]|uniref:Iron(III) transport system permease protein n=1 Tax=Microbacterium amylolyticum TaxID=936337 RepID=A0ABS4ZL20_9MICO|nr:iron ABC transporter permease [Microbacterium amylolyticum]MBP2437718.1 iron(III) transport system permease protein [Microbacterium amylolyticum]
MLTDVERSTPQMAPERKTMSWRHRTMISLRHPATILGAILIAIFGYLIVAPVVSMLLGAFQVGFGDDTRIGQSAGSLTTYYIERVFTSGVSDIIFYEPLRNTVVLSLAAIVTSLALGVPVAWLLARTDLPGRRWFSTALIVPYMLPAWTFALAWTTIFKNRRIGGAPGWLETLGFTPPDWIAYGPLPILVIFTMHFIPFVILLVTNAMKNLPDDLTEAGQVLGVPAAIRIRRIVLPLLTPAILSASTLIFAKALGEFGVAYVLGTPANFSVLSTTLYQSIQTQQPGVAAVIAAVMVALGALSVYVDVRFLREMKRFATVSGRGLRGQAQRLGRRKWVAFSGVVALFTTSVVLPLGVLVLSTVMRIPGRFEWSNFTLDYWLGQNLPTVGFSEGILVNPKTWEAAWNTIWMVGVAAVAAGVLGMLVGYVVSRAPARWVGTTLRSVTFMPYLVPGIAFAVACLSLFAVQRGPIPALYGTAILLVIVMIADEMPFASRAGTSAMMQLGRDPEEAAQTLGAGWFTRMRLIVFPIQRNALASAILLPFVSGVQGLSLVIILATPGTQLLTTLSMTLVDNGYTHAANGVVVLICVIALLGTWLARTLFRADLSSGIGS